MRCTVRFTDILFVSSSDLLGSLENRWSTLTYDVFPERNNGPSGAVKTKGSEVVLNVVATVRSAFTTTGEKKCTQTHLVRMTAAVVRGPVAEADDK